MKFKIEFFKKAKYNNVFFDSDYNFCFVLMSSFL